jgi:hypothetical protein
MNAEYGSVRTHVEALQRHRERPREARGRMPRQPLWRRPTALPAGGAKATPALGNDTASRRSAFVPEEDTDDL